MCFLLSRFCFLPLPTKSTRIVWSHQKHILRPANWDRTVNYCKHCPFSAGNKILLIPCAGDSWRHNVAGCLSVYPTRTHTLMASLQIWHTHSLKPKDEVIRFWCTEVKGQGQWDFTSFLLSGTFLENFRHKYPLWWTDCKLVVRGQRSRSLWPTNF